MTTALPPSRDREPAPDEDTRPVRVVPPKAERTMIIDPGTASADRARRAGDDIGEWPDTYRPDDADAGRLDVPVVIEPKPMGVLKRLGIDPVVVGAVTVVAVLVGCMVWLFGPFGRAGSTTAAPAVDAAAQKSLTALLPAGYPAGACTPVEATKGAVAVADCAANRDAGGPPSATYALMKDGGALDDALVSEIAKAEVLECPGNIQSPGPWRRNATPERIAGTLVCGLPEGRPQLVWSNDAELLLNVARADPEGPTLDQLYAWWSNHS